MVAGAGAVLAPGPGVCGAHHRRDDCGRGAGRAEKRAQALPGLAAGSAVSGPSLCASDLSANGRSGERGQKLLGLLPIIFLLGAQELGWRRVLQPALEKDRKSWKATAATGLITSLWFLPLLFLPWFPVRAEAYLPFAVWLLGLSFLQGTLYRRTGSVCCAALFTSAFFLLYGLLPMKDENAYYAAGALDLVVAFLYQSRLVKENVGSGVSAEH